MRTQLLFPALLFPFLLVTASSCVRSSPTGYPAATPTEISSLTASLVPLPPSAWLTQLNVFFQAGDLPENVQAGQLNNTIPDKDIAYKLGGVPDGVANLTFEVPGASQLDYGNLMLYYYNDPGMLQGRIMKTMIANPTHNLLLRKCIGSSSKYSNLDTHHAWVTGAQPSGDFIYIYSSQDGGHTWVHQGVTIPSGYAGGMTSASLPTFFGSATGVLPVVLIASSNGVVFYNSHDAGQTWTASQPVDHGGFTSVASMANYFVWDGGTTLNVSHDSGATWSVVTPNINVQSQLASFQFVNASTGWALTEDASSHHSFYQTTDGGSTWMALIPLEEDSPKTPCALFLRKGDILSRPCDSRGCRYHQCSEPGLISSFVEK